MRAFRSFRFVPAFALVLSACSAQPGQNGAAAIEETVSLRNLTETNVAAPARAHYTIEGDLIPTPSDPGARYFLLRHRTPMISDTIIAVIREERGNRIAYARVEVDCARRLFHVLGVGNRRAFAETAIAHDGPLRPIEGLPLRQELATFVCDLNKTPLARA